MNARISKLLRSYARSTAQSVKQVKKDWLQTPKNHRGEIRTEMEKKLWRQQLQDFKARHNLQGKQAADVLHVPYDTWRSWESMKNTPARWVQIALKHMMDQHAPTVNVQ